MRSWATKIKGSALQFALLVATVVILTLFSFIMLTNTHRFFKTQSNNLFASIEKSEEGIRNTLSQRKTVDGTNNTITLRESFFGGYKMISSTGKQQSKEFTKKAFIGNLEKEHKALFLTDNIQPLVFVGSSKIVGNVYLPERGVKTGAISGTYFNGGTMITGKKNRSSSQLPKLEPSFYTHIKSLLNSPKENTSLRPLKPNEQNSFFEDTKMAFYFNRVDVYEPFTGNIIIKSASEIVIHPKAALTDVTLVAPIIRIKENVQGRMHLIASDSIIIENNVRLSYPSSIVLNAKNISEEKQPAIILEEDSQIDGTILYINNQKERITTADIYIAKNAQVQGQIYCQGFLELNGTVKGTVYTNHFLAKASGSSYINHILDGSIIANDSSIEYAGLPLMTSDNTVLQWLY